MGPASLCQWCFFDCGGRRQRATQAASSASRAVASVTKLGKRRITRLQALPLKAPPADSALCTGYYILNPPLLLVPTVRERETL